MTAPAESAVDTRSFGTLKAVRLPAVVRGQVRVPGWPRIGDIQKVFSAAHHEVLGPTADGAYLVARPMIDRDSLTPTGEAQILVLPALDPRDLMEPDPNEAIRELMALSVDDVCAFVDSLGTTLASTSPGGRLAAPTSMLADRYLAATAAHVAGLFDGEALRRMMHGELGDSGMRAVEGWTVRLADVSQGVSARLAAGEESLRPPDRPRSQPQLRGVPTTQLHITAGNSPVVPVTSLLWAWASKGATVLKSAASTLPVVADLGSALMEVDRNHPLVKHTTLAYWPGGEDRVEEVLLADGSFDRRVIWGSEIAQRSVASRGAGTETIAMRPRYAISILGLADVAHDLPGTARLAAADTVVADQQACMSSLLHVVVGSSDDADRYATALAEVMSRWDEAFPHRASDTAQGGILSLRRGVLATARWNINGEWPHVTSAVVRVDRPFDLSDHPGGRLVLVRAVPDLAGALPTLLSPSVSHVGVSPGLLSTELLDVLVSHGVDNVLPLGDAERTYAGRPHDGMQILPRLIRWVTA